MNALNTCSWTSFICYLICFINMYLLLYLCFLNGLKPSSAAKLVPSQWQRNLQKIFPPWGIPSTVFSDWSIYSLGKSHKPEQKCWKFLGIITVPVTLNHQARILKLRISNLLKPLDSLGIMYCFWFLFVCFLIFWLHWVACGILVPWPGIKPVSSARESESESEVTQSCPTLRPHGH